MNIQEKINQVKSGFRPNFNYYETVKGTSIQIQAINMLLLERAKFLVYPHEDYDRNFEYSSIVEFLYEDTDGAAIKFANHLRNIVPNCLWGKYGRVIRLHDIATPWKLDNVTFDYDYGRFLFDNNSTTCGPKTIFCTDEWFILVDNHTGNENDLVDVYICKLKKQSS